MPMSRLSVADKRRVFHPMPQGGRFVIPNPWDVGSARCLQSLGFKALATSTEPVVSVPKPRAPAEQI
jgi:2-methylisocitrate lyase-like PEP mutase family enzyme